VKLFKAGQSVTDIAMALSIGRGSVNRALEATGVKSASGLDLIQISGESPQRPTSKKARGGVAESKNTSAS
jgi:hypothetical protein